MVTLNDLKQRKRDEILRLAGQYGVHNVRVFGSVARDESVATSDVDFLVDGLENAPWGGGRLLIELEQLLGCHVDLVSLEDLHESIRERVLNEAVGL